jgi:uncharacterized membrane protein
MERPRGLKIILISALAVVYVSLRFWHLTDSCLWFDEIFSVHAAEHDWSSLLRFVRADLIHPPFFYLILKIWILASGESIFWLRILPVIFALMSVVPFLLFCRELAIGLPATSVAFLFFAVNGSLIKYSQEVRMYSLLLFLSLTSLWLFSRYFSRGKGIVSLTIVNLLLVYTHYFGWFAIASEMIAILIFQRIKIRAAIISFLAVLLAFAPWCAAIVVALFSGADIDQNLGWVSRPGARALAELIFGIVQPFYYQASSIDEMTIWYVSIPLLVLIGLAIMVYLAVGTEASEQDRFRLLLMAVGVPVALAFMFSWILPVSIWGMRHLTIVFVPAIILFAVFIAGLKPVVLRYVAMAGLVSVMVVGFFVEVRTERPEFIWCQWEKLAKNIPDDRPQTVYAFEDLTAYHLWFAKRKNANVRVVKINEIPEMTEDKAYFLPREFDGVGVAGPNEFGGESFWIAFRDMQWNDRHPPVNILRQSGYTISPPIESDAQGMKAFLVEVRR